VLDLHAQGRSCLVRTVFCSLDIEIPVQRPLELLWNSTLSTLPWKSPFANATDPALFSVGFRESPWPTPVALLIYFEPFLRCLSSENYAFDYCHVPRFDSRYGEN
jgi:hypothetical protein